MFYVNFIYKFHCLLIYWTSFADADILCVAVARVKINPKIGNQSMSHPWHGGSTKASKEVSITGWRAAVLDTSDQS